MLYALADLYVLEMFYLKEISNCKIEPDIPDNESKLFVMEQWEAIAIYFFEHMSKRRKRDGCWSSLFLYPKRNE